MIVKKKPEATIVFNDKENFLVMSSLDRKVDIPIITIRGWFGEKLYELLKSDGDLERFFKISPFAHDNELVKTFKRLLLTLIREDFINASCDKDKEREFARLRPFSEREYANFSCGDFTGGIDLNIFAGEELQADAHNYSADYAAINLWSDPKDFPYPREYPYPVT